MHAHMGTDTYGRVKSVGNTPIVTKFFMVNAIPLFPLQSFYLKSVSRVAVDDMPILGNRRLEIEGIALAKIDRASVAIAYLRGACGGLFVLGFIGSIFMTVTLLNGAGAMAIDPWETLYISLLLLAIGVVCGLLTYVIPLTSRREREIRQHCGELLGICADPALTYANVAAEICHEQLQRDTIGENSEASLARLNDLLQLIIVRCEMAQGTEVARGELVTDQLLARLKRCGRPE